MEWSVEDVREQVGQGLRTSRGSGMQSKVRRHVPRQVKGSFDAMHVKNRSKAALGNMSMKLLSTNHCLAIVLVPGYPLDKYDTKRSTYSANNGFHSSSRD